MSISFRILAIIITLTIFFSSKSLKAQPRTGEFINASIGLGISAPYEDVDISSTGFYAQGEYVLGITKWFGLRPYAGIILTSGNVTENESLKEYKVNTKAFSFGGKVRLVAPIPYVAPYIESGIGASIGTFQTYTPTTNIKKSGVLLHIPFSLGLAVGRKHNVDIAFTYLFIPAAEQFTGAAAVGLTFPIKN
ncbi:MAG: hypothetical protein RIR01_413 [Bacteroidota bacterium]